MAEQKIQIVIEGVDRSGTATLRELKNESDGLATSLQSMGESLQSTGGALNDGLTKPLVGIAEEAIGASTELNGMMANVESLGLSSDRVVELKSSVQDLAIDMGKHTSDMAGGLYQVVSAFGDSSDAVAELEVAAKAGAAGLASTEDAIALISSVTKGYGDTSLEAQKKVSDLAFQTVSLGQTTFPELAASMGKVVPMAAALGVSQEELFAQMSTLTGVTGGAAEVSTQLRATYQALLKPTGEMGGAIQDVATQLESQGKLAGGPLVDAWLNAKGTYEATAKQLMVMKNELAGVDTSSKSGAQRAKELKDAIREQEKAAKDAGDAMDKHAAALGPVLVNSIGLNDTLKLLSATAGGNTDELGQMFGSVESLNAVLALSGGQAESFEQKLTAMGDAAGLTDKAFEAQTNGLNKNGFTWEQLQVKVEVLMQKLGDGLAPALSSIFEIMQPLVDQVMALADWFANADSSTQTWIVGIVAAAAAIGPLLVGVGMVVSAIGAAMPVIGAIGGALALLTGPIGLVVAGVGLLALAIYNDWGGIGTFVSGVVSSISTALGEVPALFRDVGDAIAWIWQGKGDNIDWWSDITDGLVRMGLIGQETGDKLAESLFNAGATISNAFVELPGIFRDVGDAIAWIWQGKGDNIDWWNDITDGLVRMGLIGQETGDKLAESLFNVGSYASGVINALNELSTSDDLATLQGNVTTALSDIGTAVHDYFAGDISLGGLASAVSQGFTDIGAALSAFFGGGDWSQFLTVIQWEDFIPVLSSWADYVTSLDWTGYVVQLLDWATWIPALVWNGFVAVIDWTAYLSNLDWDDKVSKLGWDTYIDSALNWSSYVVKLPWSDWIDKSLSWASYVLQLTWSSFVSKLDWPSVSFNWDWFVPKVSWPSFSFDWSWFVPKFEWPRIPEFHWADWIGQLIPGNNAEGTPNWKGGMTWVGEKGPELVALPRGTRIYNNRESMAMANRAVSGGGALQPVTVNVYATVKSEIDVNRLAYEVADVIRRAR